MRDRRSARHLCRSRRRGGSPRPAAERPGPRPDERGRQGAADIPPCVGGRGLRSQRRRHALRGQSIRITGIRLGKFLHKATCHHELPDAITQTLATDAADREYALSEADGTLQGNSLVAVYPVYQPVSSATGCAMLWPQQIDDDDLLTVTVLHVERRDAGICNSSEYRRFRRLRQHRSQQAICFQTEVHPVRRDGADLCGAGLEPGNH